MADRLVIVKGDGPEWVIDLEKNPLVEGRIESGELTVIRELDELPPDPWDEPAASRSSSRRSKQTKPADETPAPVEDVPADPALDGELDELPPDPWDEPAASRSSSRRSKQTKPADETPAPVEDVPADPALDDSAELTEQP